MNRKHKKKSNNNSGLAKMAIEAGPPKILLNPILKKFRMRWKVTTAVGASQLTYKALIYSLMLRSGAIGETGALLLFEAVKLRRIQMWAPAVLGAQVAFEANSNQTTLFGSDPRRFTDSSSNTAYSAYVDWRPSKSGLDLANSWINPQNTSVSNANVIGSIKADVGSIIDITFDATVSDGSFPFLHLSASVTAAVAGTYAFQWDANIISVDYNMLQ